MMQPLHWPRALRSILEPLLASFSLDYRSSHSTQNPIAMGLVLMF
jgi:hypothetical protein